MRKIIMFNMLSLDGYYEDIDGKLDWHVVDDEFNQYGIEILNNVDTILFGRKTYQLFESYWPNALANPETGQDDRQIAEFIDNAEKFVYSKTLGTAVWKNSHILHEVEPLFIHELKAKEGKDIVIYGSGSICQQLSILNLIDEYRVIINPTILGKGKPLFKNVNQKKLTLIDNKIFQSGNVLLVYKP